ncbi:hypothetical protein [Candidatus Bodocaedibacter vickermanii]|uniref:Signal peptide peptidase SppA n=1 Tax=Candidatus Bodocaedibacter vickermanii TaxID=2741701 RepID=A0A7L9RUK3_9PROT|nr:signal peptide peptidase SppA [Candidatus Paracaedibacteraceae bacterium 'Lake Konstanz']
MKKKLVFVWVVLSVVTLITSIGYGVRVFLEPKLLSANTTYQLYIHLSSTVHDFPSANPLAFSLRFSPNVWEIDQGLRAAADESKISSTLIHLDNVRLTVSQAYTIGEAIHYFRSKGKKVICYSTSFDSKNGGVPAYVLASYCDVIQLQRFGSVSLHTLQYDGMLKETHAYKSVSIVRKNRNSTFELPEMPLIDMQAVNVGLVDAVVSELTQSEHAIVIQDYVRLLGKSHKDKGSIVAVIPILDGVNDDTLKAICSRFDIRAVVIYDGSKSGIDRSAEKIGDKPVVVCVPDQGADKQRGSLHDAIDSALQLAGLNKDTVRIEVIHPGSYVFYIMSDLSSFGKSIVSMLKRSVNYVVQMIYGGV